MSSKNMLLKKNMGFLLVALLSIGIVTEISLITNANALNYYFNCVTKKVNKNEKFEIEDAFACYDNVFKGAQKYSNESYQNPDLANLDSIKPVASTSSATSNDDETKDKPIITPDEETKKTNGNPVADEETKKTNGNPVADEVNKKTGNPVADEAEETPTNDDAESNAKSTASDDDAESNAKSPNSDVIPKVDTVGKPNSSPKSLGPVNENQNKGSSPNKGSNSGLLDISPLYKTFDLPFTAVIPK
jgi:hypothetical protein